MDDLVEEVTALRLRAGEPSLAALVKLLKEQRNPMARSTIGNKLNGTSRIRLHELLAFVRAFSVYASHRGIPLSAKDMDEDLWRKRFDAVPRPRVAQQLSSPDVPTSTSPAVREQRPAWDLTPLRRAQMHDLIEYVEEHSDDPMDQWLPNVVGNLGTAGMSVDQFLLAAVARPIPELVDIMESLLADDDERALNRIVELCAARRPPEDFPGLLAELRRSDLSGAVMLSDDLVTAIPRGRPFDPHLSVDNAAVRILTIANVLREATMNKDCQKLLETLGRRGRAGYIIDVLSILPDNQMADRWRILDSIGKGSPQHVFTLLHAISKNAAVSNKDEARKNVLDAVPPESLEELRRLLEAEGMSEEASRLGRRDSPPLF